MHLNYILTYKLLKFKERRVVFIIKLIYEHLRWLMNQRLNGILIKYKKKAW